MCPLRILLLFLSASLAGYFAWRSVRSADPTDDDARTPDSKRDLRKVVGDGFWGFVDMASGRYLWRNLVEAKARD